MKWKNIDIGASHYYITATFTEWLPLLTRNEIRQIVCEEINRELREIGGSLAAYVLMPDHLHILPFLPDNDLLHAFSRRWRGRSARRIIDLLKAQEDEVVLSVLARHANGDSKYAVWKEQVRALAIWDERKLRAKADYIHANPVRRGLVSSPDEWELSSYVAWMQGCEVRLG